VNAFLGVEYHVNYILRISSNSYLIRRVHEVVEIEFYLKRQRCKVEYIKKLNQKNYI